MVTQKSSSKEISNPSQKYSQIAQESLFSNKKSPENAKSSKTHSIEFKLFAPYNQGATLIGSFSNWEEIPMEKDEKGYFNTTVNLEDGVYQYKFRVQTKSWFFEPDEWVEVVDPYAPDVIENSDVKKEVGVLRIKNGKKIVDEYVWKHDDVPLPQDCELVIYEMHIADFCGGKDGPKTPSKYIQAIQKLDYLCELGINAIELMPVKEYPGKYSWGYNPRHFFSTESGYGTTAELKQFIDECHARGIRVIIDGIYNHSDVSCPLTQIDHDYWFHHSPRDPNNSWGPEFNYEKYDENLGIKPAWQFVGDTVRYWVQEYHIDGIRYDASRQIANYDFMHWVVKEAKKAASMKPFYNVAEYIPDTPSITNLDGPMDACWHDSFLHLLRPQLCGDYFDLEQLKDVIDGKRQGYMGATNVVNYLSNHDHDHVLADFGDRGIFDEAAFKRRKLGAAIVITAMGVPLIWMGEEFGESKHKNIDSCKIDWSLLKNDLNRDLFEYYKNLIRLRKNNHALYTENVNFFHENPDCKVLAYVRWNGEGSRVIVVANFSDNFLAGYTVPNFPEDGMWHEWTYDYDVEAKDGKVMIDLAEWEAKVLVWKQDLAE